MRFEKALKCMREGKKVNPNVTGYGWRVFYYLDMRKRELLMDVYDDTKLYEGGVSTTLNFEEIISEDWEVVEDDNK